MRRMKTIHRLWAILFCIIISLTGIYTSDREIDSLSSYTDLSKSISAAARRDRSFDAIDYNFMTAVSKVNSDFTGLTKGIKSALINYENSYYIKQEMSGVALTAWAILTVSPWNVIVDKMYLIQFIHASDGEKGVKQVFSWHNQI